MDKAIIFAAGKYGDERPPENFNGLIIAADAGFKACEKFGLVPDFIIGDFDSLNFTPNRDNVIKLPVEKDETDLEAAIKICKEKNVREIYIYGALGGRLDHTLGNISLLAALSENNIKCFLYGENSIITAVTNGCTKIQAPPKTTVSVIPWTENAFGVNLRGFKYPLDSYTMKNTATLGISNILLENEGEIEVHSGTLIIIINTKI